MESIIDTRSLPAAFFRGIGRTIRKFQSLVKSDRFGLTLFEYLRLRYSPRLKHTTAPLLGKRIALTDPYWYLFCYDEIFKQEIYKFKSSSDTPLIIDCGANIGLSVIYFKHLYPNAQIIAFEPDQQIFQVLQQNVETFGLANVDLHDTALWISETELSFQPDGSVGGRLFEGGSSPQRVTTSRLKDFANRPIEFLKIDIEGAEHVVLKDCADVIHNVEHLFVEHHGIDNAESNLIEILQILQNAGFHYHIKEAWPVRHPFLREDPRGYPLQLNIFAFRP